jgi:glycine/D-amino acid oxidase-like deaminating enzyme
LNPSVDARPLSAVYLPDEGAIDARAVLDAIVFVAERGGVTFVDDAVVGWETDGNRASCAITGTGARIHAGRFLVAAGAASHGVLRDLREDAAPLPPVMSGKGVAATCRGVTSGPECVVRTPNRAGGCGLHMVPGANGTVYLGATNDLRPRPDDDLASIGMAHFLLTCAMEQLNNRLFQADVERWHVGNRPGSVDGYPLIGRVWQDNVWLLTGTYRDGFHCSPILARHMADTVLGGEGVLGDEHPFTPLRRPLRTMSREEAIDEVALHMVSQFYEYSARPPTYMRVAEGLESQVRARTRATYDLLQTDLGLAPEILELLNWGPDRETNIGRFRRYLKLAA